MARFDTSFDATSVEPTTPMELLPAGKYRAQIVESIRLDQALFSSQFRSALMRALASSMSFRMSAVRATFGGFPALIMA